MSQVLDTAHTPPRGVKVIGHSRLLSRDDGSSETENNASGATASTTVPATRPSEMTQVPLWLTILLPLTGYVAAVGTEFLRNRWQATREIQHRVAQREDARQDRREEFELAVLKDTYSALARLARAAMRYHLADREVAKKLNVKYASRQIGDVTGPELEEEFRVSTGDLKTQIQLLLNDEIRHVVTSAGEALLAPSSMHDSDVEDAQRAMNLAVLEVNQAQSQLGRRIRELYTASPV